MKDCNDLFKGCRLVKRAGVDRGNASGENYGMVRILMGIEDSLCGENGLLKEWS